MCASASECVLERGWPLWCWCFEIVCAQILDDKVRIYFIFVRSYLYEFLTVTFKKMNMDG